MAKIGRRNETISVKGINTYLHMDLYYSTKRGFYVYFEEKYSDSLKCFIDERKLGIILSFDSKLKKFYVSSENENQALFHCTQVYRFIHENDLQEDKVIIVFFSISETRFNNHRYNTEHPQIPMKFGLTYALRKKIGDKEIYYQYNNNGERRNELNLWNEASTIIPDTPENRDFLESIYDKFKILCEQMKKFTESDTILLEFIKSNIKLIG